MRRRALMSSWCAAFRGLGCGQVEARAEARSSSGLGTGQRQAQGHAQTPAQDEVKP